MNINNEKGQLNRFSKETETCDGTIETNIIDDFFIKFQDSFCFTFVLQFLMVLLMYYNVGKGKYWKILFYAALAGFLGAMFENGTVAFICSRKDTIKYVYTFLIDEIFWIPNEYAIPLLNLIKMKAFSEGKIGPITKYTIIFLSIPFIFFRFCIGYLRMTNGYLQDQRIHAFHGYAFAVVAIADIICTVVLLYLIKINNKKIAISGSNINDFVKHSSYTILITVDIVSAILSITNILANVGPYKDSFPKKLFTPFHCLKCSAILILAIDAFIFKYGANVSSNNESSENKFYGNDSSQTYNNTINNSNNSVINNTNNNSVTSNYRAKLTNFNTEMNSSINKNSRISSIAPYNFSPIDKSPTRSTRSPSVSNSRSPSISHSRSIIKNYSGNKSSNTNITNDSGEHTIYSGQSFGFLNQQQPL